MPTANALIPLPRPPAATKTMKRAVDISVTGAFFFYLTVSECMCLLSCMVLQPRNRELLQLLCLPALHAVGR